MDDRDELMIVDNDEVEDDEYYTEEEESDFSWGTLAAGIGLGALVAFGVPKIKEVIFTRRMKKKLKNRDTESDEGPIVDIEEFSEEDSDE